MDQTECQLCLFRECMSWLVTASNLSYVQQDKSSKHEVDEQADAVHVADCSCCNDTGNIVAVASCRVFGSGLPSTALQVAFDFIIPAYEHH